MRELQDKNRGPAGEAALWRRAMRDVRPLPGRPQPDRGRPARPAPATRTVQSATSAVAAAPAAVAAPPLPPAALPPLDRFAGLDRASAERLKRGRRAIEARLDLHGLTQAEAHRSLTGFVARSRVLGRRCVLVITGHGRLGGGVLKAAVPRWLDEPGLRRNVLAIAPAQPQHGGAGALYVLLRRSRDGTE